jgi:hypothetical protein
MWRALSAKERRQRLALKDLSTRYMRRRVVRTAKYHALAKSYFAKRAGWSFKQLCFANWRRDTRRIKEGQRKMMSEYFKLQTRKKLLAMKAWKFVTERLTWQSACLRIANGRQKARCFEEWRGFIHEEKATRVLCEQGEREFKRMKQRRALRKLGEEVKRRKGARWRADASRKQYEKRLKRRAVELMVSNCMLLIGQRRAEQRALAWRRRHLKERGMGKWRVTARDIKIKKVQRLAAMLMSNKRSLVVTFRAWEGYMRRQVGLRACVISGLALMKVRRLRHAQVSSWLTPITNPSFCGTGAGVEAVEVGRPAREDEAQVRARAHHRERALGAACAT